jgi:hypothetical protein
VSTSSVKCRLNLVEKVSSSGEKRISSRVNDIRLTFFPFVFHPPITILPTQFLGDPRMHKAVAARLATPSLSLYEALVLGGFSYAENDDKSVLDSKKVTLGQRKNQLSRRLRLARKQDVGEQKTSPSADRVLFDENSSHRNGTNGIANLKTEEGEQTNLNGKPNDPLSTIGHHRTKMDLINELGTSSFNNHSSGRNGEAMEAQQQKRQRFTKCLNSTTFERTCTMAPVMNHKLPPNTNQYLTQGWPLGNLPQMGGDGSSNALMAPGSLLGSTQGVNYSSSQYYSPQMTSIMPDQNVQRYQHGKSAVALSSLGATAQSVGLSLDQLALTLSSNTTSLSKLIAEVRSGDSEIKKEQMALDLYQADVKGLYTKCLLVAGVDSSLVEQNTPTYIEFATKAWEAEGKRLRTLQDTTSRGKGTKSVNFASPPRHIQGVPNSILTNKDDGNNESAMVSSDSSGYDQNNDHHNYNHDHNYNHNHNHDNSHYDHNHNHNHIIGQHAANDDDALEKHDRLKCDARHMHRLGECGHRAIIHQPKDGPPHIDFIVNDQVECYAGHHDSMSLAGRSFDTAWPSNHKCKDVEESCGKACGKSVASEIEAALGREDYNMVNGPKVFKLSDIDTSDPEWTFESNEDADGGVMGLFKLGRESSNELANT